MTVSFDDLYEKVSKDKQKSSGAISSFDELYEKVNQKKKPERSFTEKAEAAPRAAARGIASGIAGTPRAFSGLLKSGSEYLSTKGRELAEREGREVSPEEKKFTDYTTKVLGLPERLLEKVGFPTYEESVNWMRKKMEPENYEPSGLEKGLETAGGFLGSSVVTPGSSFGGVGKAAMTALGASGAGTASAAGMGPGAQFGASIAVPAVAQAINLIRTGKLNPTGAQAKQLYEEGKRLGLSDAELTPILQSQAKKDVLGFIAKPTRRAERAIQRSEAALGNLYEKVKNKSSTLRRANRTEEQFLLGKIDAVKQDLQKSKLKPGDKQKVIEEITKLESDIAANGIGADEIVATWQDINQLVNWNSFKEGKKSLAALKDPFENILKSISPEDAKEFAVLNKMWGKLQKTAEKVRPTDTTNFLKLGEAGHAMHGLISLISTGNPGSLKVFLGSQGARILATEMLTNPRLNNLLNKTIASALPATQKAVNKAVLDFEEGLRKDFPELYRHFKEKPEEKTQ